jgi:hypothetical protein
MPYFFCFFLMCILFSCQKESLYESREFLIRHDRVEQDTFIAVARSDQHLVSDYRSPYRIPTSREFYFKFSINGEDNERAPGEDHRIVIDDSDSFFETAIYTFGRKDPVQVRELPVSPDPYLDKGVTVRFRCDMNPVLRAFESKGYYVTPTGDRITRETFEGLYIAGSQLPLTWNFSDLNKSDRFRMQDEDGDGIYTIELVFLLYQSYEEQGERRKEWRLAEDISRFPEHRSDQLLIDALHNLSLEELLLNIREDGALIRLVE